MLFLGVFAPFVKAPIVGDVNYFANGKGDGVIIIALAVVSLFLTLGRLYWGLLVTGILSLGMLGFTFVNFHMRMSEARSEMARTLAGNPFRGLSERAVESIQVAVGIRGPNSGSNPADRRSCPAHREVNAQLDGRRARGLLLALIGTDAVLFGTRVAAGAELFAHSRHG